MEPRAPRFIDKQQHFFDKGWCAFDPDPVLASWAEAARPLAEATLHDPQMRADWLRCGGTWFAGVNALANDAAGAIPGAGVPPLAGRVVAFIAEVLGLRGGAWDRAQVSICFPGYPQPWDGESDAAFRFRRDRDAARFSAGSSCHLGAVGAALGRPLRSINSGGSLVKFGGRWGLVEDAESFPKSSLGTS